MIMKRRDFIQTSLLAAGAASLSSFAFAADKKNIGLQLYSLRDVIFKDPKGILKKVADFGYTEMETFGYKDGMLFGMSNADFGAYTKSIGLKVTSGHYGIDIVQGANWEKAISDAKAIGQEYMIMPYLMENDRPTKVDGYKKLCASLNKAGELCNKQGIRFGYHNHAFEFDIVEEQIPYDIMLNELDPKLVMMEMDLYWMYNAKQDPFKYFEKYPGRFELWHVKDMNKEDRNKNADVGTGTIDFKALFAKAKQSGLKHFFIEQESYPESPIKSIEACAINIRKII
jgi:sugar phosphate isomerase/epimerase